MGDRHQLPQRSWIYPAIISRAAPLSHDDLSSRQCYAKRQTQTLKTPDAQTERMPPR
jgi:hypothetical protein